jgi:hypothetical protein
LISLFDLPGSKQGRRAIRPAIFGAVALASVVAVAGCGGGSSAGSGSSSSSSKTSSFSKCLEEHGVTPPQGAGSGGFGGSGSGATPHARPTGSAASSFKQAIQACGGSGNFHGGSAG